jgi:uncharacterized membrane protein SpoIIM required for sporulation
MDLATFIARRRPQWRQLEAVLQRVEGSGLGALDEEQAVEFGQLYRSAASDLNQAQTFVSGDATVQYLNDLVARCYAVIYARTRLDLWAVVRYLVQGYPVVFRRNFGHVVLAGALLAAGAVFGFLVSHYDAQAARAFLLPRNFPTIQPGQEGRAASVGELAAFSAFLFRNNLSVSLVAFALGITLGVGTAWVMFQNGMFMGVLAAIFFEAGEFTAFCTGILPHGVLEIPAALIGGAAGFVLAQGIIRARPWPRLEELARAGKEAVWLVGGCVPLLIGAAFVEAVIARAPDRYINSGLKLAVAGVLGLLFFAYVLLPGWRRPLTPNPSPLAGEGRT